MMSKMMRPRQRMVKHSIMRKIHFDTRRYMICLAIMGTTICTLFMSWGAMHVEAYGNRSYDRLPNSGTDVTCIYTETPDSPGPNCTHLITGAFHQRIVYYGVRIDCMLSSPLLLISFYFFFYESFGYYMLLWAHSLAWCKFISINAVLSIVLMNRSTFMRETFEKAQFGSYESRLLYSFTMLTVSAFFDFAVCISLIMASFHTDSTPQMYRVGPPQYKDLKQVECSHAKAKQIVAKRKSAGRVSVVQAYPIEDPVVKEQAATKCNPV